MHGRRVEGAEVEERAAKVLVAGVGVGLKCKLVRGKSENDEGGEAARPKPRKEGLTERWLFGDLNVGEGTFREEALHLSRGASRHKIHK